jgi:hypothetical protein
VSGLWLTLLPLIAGSALAPVQSLLTLLLLRRPSGGVLAAAALVSGMTMVRLIQGLLFALLLPGDSIDAGTRGAKGSGPVEAGILIVLAMLLFATAVEQALAEEDPDAPPPKWMTTAQSISAPRAFLVGVGLILIGAKAWIFSLGVVGAVRDSGVSTRAGVLTFLAYAALSAVIPLLLIGVRLVAPARSSRFLDCLEIWLERHQARIVIALSLVFGTWFLLTGLSWLDVI